MNILHRRALWCLLIFGLIWTAPLLAQATTSDPGGSPPPGDPLSWQLTLAAVSTYLVQYLKRSTWFPVYASSSVMAQRVVSAFVAACAAVGIHMQFDSTAGTLAVTGLTVATIWHLGGQVMQQYVFQHVMYVGAVKPDAA